MTLPIPTPKIDSRRKYFPTQEIDEALRTAYSKGIVPGKTLPALAKRYRRPKSWLKTRAIQLGLPVQRIKMPHWKDDEIEALCAIAHHHPAVIARRMVKKGYPRRTQTAIVVKLKRLKIYRSVCRADAGWYTGTGLAEMIGKDSHLIVRWIDSGWLKAHRAGSSRTGQQNGDFWLIHERDIRDMVRERAETLELGRWDRRFLADVLIDPKPKGAAPLINQEAP